MICLVMFNICSCVQLLLPSQVVYINKVSLFMLLNNVYKNSFFPQERNTLIEFITNTVILIRSSKMQQYAGIYFLQNHSTYFGCPSFQPSSDVA